MLRKNLSIFFAISFLVLLSGVANAYFFSTTDGPNLFLLRAETGSNGKLAITSEFKYAAPGTVGSTALLPVPGSAGTRSTAIIKFDLFGTFVSNGKPVVFRDRLEFDTSSATWRNVSRKLFPTHKLDSYNTFSAAVSTNPTSRLLLTENGSNVNRRKVNSSGNLVGGNKVTFKNASQVDPLAAALSPDGTFAAQSTFTSSALSAQTGLFGLSLKRFKDGKSANYNVSGEIANLAIAFALLTGQICIADLEAERGGFRSGTVQGVSAADKTGVFYVRFDATTLQLIGNVTTISRMSSTALLQQKSFNTTLLLPDAKGIFYPVDKAGKLEYFLQPLNGACGPKKGRPYRLLSITDPIIKNNNPLRGWAVAACQGIPFLCD